MNRHTYVLILSVFLLSFALVSAAKEIIVHRGFAKTDKPVYLDLAQPIDTRIEDLLSRMTLEEKVGQINMPCVYEDGLGKTEEEKMEAVKKRRLFCMKA